MAVSVLGFAALVLTACPPTFPEICSGAECGELAEGGADVDWTDAPRKVVGLALGQTDNCALLSNGQVTCWDVRHNQFRSRLVEGIADAVQIASGPVTCAVRKNGQVACWGQGYDGMLGDGQEHGYDELTTTPVPVHGLTDAIQVKVGDTLACVLRQGGTIACWGAGAIETGDGQRPPPALVPTRIEGISNAIQIAVGFNHACALTANGMVSCWGWNGAGQTGQSLDSSVANRTPKPTIVPGVIGAVEIVTGWEHTCARNENGSVQCWGRSTSGADQSGSSVPPLVADLTDTVELAAGTQATCARKRDGTVVCWGSNRAGQLGAGAPPSVVMNSATPVQVQDISNAVTLDVGSDSACVASGGGQVACWGHNRNNVLGGSDSVVRAPVPVQGMPSAFEVAAGSSFSCAVRADTEQVACWGSNGFGALGAGIANTDPAVMDNARTTAVALPAMPRTKAITAGDDYACALAYDGSVRCWGNNRSGQLGIGDPNLAMSTIPLVVSTLTGIVELSTGRDIACARDAAGAIKCWGHKWLDLTATPESVPDLTAVQISAGAFSACALRARPGDIVCWGKNFSGALGDGTYTNSKRPVTVLNIHDAIQVGVGSLYACAVRSSGQVLCWGTNSYGELGIGQVDEAPHPVPIPVMNITDAIEVRCGTYGTCARRRNGELVCWGKALVPNNPDGSEPTPPYPPGAGVRGLVASRFALGRSHACAIGEGNRVVCWGAGSNGERGDGRMLFSASPVVVPVNP